MATEQEILVYPNPTKGGLTVDFGTPVQQELELKVLNNIGVVIENVKVEKSMSNFELDFSNYPTGIYYIEVIDAEGNRTSQKIVKQD